MDPLSALSLGYNVLDLVSRAVDCVLTVKQIYDSAEGLQKANETVRTQADRMKEVVGFLREKQSEIAATDNEEVKAITTRCAAASEQLYGVLDECKAKGKSVFAAGGTAIKSFRNRNKIVTLQQELKDCQSDLHLFIGITSGCTN